MDRSSRQEINKEIMTLNNTLDQLDYIYIYMYQHRENFLKIWKIMKMKNNSKCLGSSKSNFKGEVIG